MKRRGNLRTVFALADSAITVLPPNQEPLFGLNSMNSYDSLSSRRYQELMEHRSAAAIRMYGRHFGFLDIEWALADRRSLVSGIHLILSAHPLAADQLTLAAKVRGIKLYETVTAPVDLLQTPRFKFSNAGEAALDPSAGPANLQSP